MVEASIDQYPHDPGSSIHPPSDSPSPTCDHPSFVRHSAGAVFDVEGISKALQEDTSKKYSDDGLGLVETLKKRCIPCLCLWFAILCVVVFCVGDSVVVIGCEDGVWVGLVWEVYWVMVMWFVGPPVERPIIQWSLYLLHPSIHIYIYTNKQERAEQGEARPGAHGEDFPQQRGR